MKRIIAMILMSMWCVLSVWLQLQYLKPGMTPNEWIVVTICVVPFYIVLFICIIKNTRRARKKKR